MKGADWTGTAGNSRNCGSQWHSSDRVIEPWNIEPRAPVAALEDDR